MPGLLSLSLIMLMFTATIAFIVEVENKTMIRLKLSRLSTLEFLFGTGIVQIAIGIGSFLLTLLLALSLGFSTDGSLLLVIFIAGICSISIIAFSLIVAALTRTVNEVLVIGNFPLFLFMFFTGAAFPMSSGDMFVFAGYHFPIHGLMSPTHAISALNKVLIMNAGIGEIIPELVSLCGLAIVYFIIGAWAFRWRHMRMG
jgi:ABC-2 type transport system permease protein